MEAEKNHLWPRVLRDRQIPVSWSPGLLVSRCPGDVGIVASGGPGVNWSVADLHTADIDFENPYYIENTYILYILQTTKINKMFEYVQYSI